MKGLILVRYFITYNGLWIHLYLERIVLESCIPFTLFLLRTWANAGRYAKALVCLILLLDFNRFLIFIRAQMSGRFSKIIFLLLSIIFYLMSKLIAIGQCRKSDYWTPIALAQLMHLACGRCGRPPPDIPPLLPIHFYSFCLLYLLIHIMSGPGWMLEAII